MYIYKNMYFHIFTRSLRDEETKFDMMRFYSLIRIFLKPQERAWFFYGEGPHSCKVSGMDGQTSGRRGAGRE